MKNNKQKGVKNVSIFGITIQIYVSLHSYLKGRMAEWLGSALQKHLHQFESDRNLNKKTNTI